MPDYHVIPTPPEFHPFSTVLASDDLIFVSGLAWPVGTVAEQVRGCFDRIAELLEEVGSSMSEVIHVRPAVSDRAYLDELQVALHEVLPTPPPATGVLVIAPLLTDDMKVEFEVIAQRGARLLPPTD